MQLLATLLFCLIQLAAMYAAYNVPGVPDSRNLKTKISRGSGMGPINFGYAFVVLLAFAIFLIALGLVIFYKRDRNIRNKERTLFLTTY